LLALSWALSSFSFCLARSAASFALAFSSAAELLGFCLSRGRASSFAWPFFARDALALRRFSLAALRRAFPCRALALPFANLGPCAHAPSPSRPSLVPHSGHCGPFPSPEPPSLAPLSRLLRRAFPFPWRPWRGEDPAPCALAGVLSAPAAVVGLGFLRLDPCHRFSARFYVKLFIRHGFPNPPVSNGNLKL